VVDSLKALDPNRPIREATKVQRSKKYDYSITSSAIAIRDCRIVRLSALAVLRLITSFCDARFLSTVA
jgi:hypothetical protein